MGGQRYANGFTLIELMIAVAIIAVLSGIAIPLYNQYVKEAHLSTARMNTEPLRLALEDFRLDNGTYGNVDGSSRSEVWIPDGSTTLSGGDLAWRPDGDNEQYDYSVTAGTDSYTISVTHRGSGRAANCEKTVADGFTCKYKE